MVQYAPMAKKDIVETDECLSFRASLNESELREYQHIRAQLAQDGFLVAPLAEKVERDLYAIRIRKGGNARFFYCYDDGTAVWILNGYEKKSERIPLRELQQAKRLKRKYGL